MADRLHICLNPDIHPAESSIIQIYSALSHTYGMDENASGKHQQTAGGQTPPRQQPAGQPQIKIDPTTPPPFHKQPLFLPLPATRAAGQEISPHRYKPGANFSGT